MKTALKYSAGLIGLYLLVYYYTGTGDLLNNGSAGASKLVATFQGR